MNSLDYTGGESSGQRLTPKLYPIPHLCDVGTSSCPISVSYRRGPRVVVDQGGVVRDGYRPEIPVLS